jgi:xylulokinase
VSLLGVDIGSSSCKAAVFSVSGQTLASASRSYATVSPGPGMLEVDPESIWSAAAAAIREAAASSAADPVQALSFSSHGETFVPVNAAGVPVGRAVMNADNRAVAEAEWLQEAIGFERLYGLVGAASHPMYPLAKLRWLRAHAPTVFSAAARFLGPAEYILQRLGLPAVTDHSLACRWMAFDIRARRWAPELLEAGGLRAGLLPEAVPAGTPAGRLSPAAAESLGVPAGLVVAVGGHDQPCSALGAGAIEPGIVSDSAGSYECLSCASSAPSLGPAALRSRLNSYCHVVPGSYITLSFFPSGMMVRWFVERLAEAEAARAAAAGVDSHDWFESRAPAGPTGLIVTPHLIGACNPHWNPRATAAAVGFTAAADLFHLYKGIIEGIACEFALNATALQDACGPYQRVRMAGGGARSLLGLRLRAALAGRTLEILGNPDAVCLGAAILAGTAAGIYRDLPDGVSRAVSIAAVHQPDPALAHAYRPQQERYAALYPAIAPLFGT